MLVTRKSVRWGLWEKWSVEALAVLTIAYAALSPMETWQKLLFALTLSFLVMLRGITGTSVAMMLTETQQRLFLFALTDRIAMGEALAALNAGRPPSLDWNSAIKAASADIMQAQTDANDLNDLGRSIPFDVAFGLLMFPGAWLFRIAAGFGLAQTVHAFATPGFMHAIGL